MSPPMHFVKYFNAPPKPKLFETRILEVRLESLSVEIFALSHVSWFTSFYIFDATIIAFQILGFFPSLLPLN
jgi:hypothetical protein